MVTSNQSQTLTSLSCKAGTTGDSCMTSSPAASRDHLPAEPVVRSADEFAYGLRSAEYIRTLIYHSNRIHARYADRQREL